ncbi:UvrD-helicase domain-containing protein, partial [Thermodesulfobacteriota bacterium]
IGNIKSDGRPILGLGARGLLEILLETSDQAFLVPAHIWTPWFSLLGSKSGFDSLEECFEDLTSHIFAVETGLSSDPAMNWRVSGLDGLTLISNSDAHSPLKLGREASLFNTALSYSGIKSAIQTGDPKQFLGTFEFYPEEGKYHLDGHRKCNVRLSPKETIALNGKCPVCEKALTLGVLYRVEELADRPEGIKPEKSHPFFNLIPLVDILSDVLMVGPGSKKVMGNYRALIEKLGPEFAILHSLEIGVIEKAGVPLLGEAIKRMRTNEINFLPGYDGEFGKLQIFNPEEREMLINQKPLFVLPVSDRNISVEEKHKETRIPEKTRFKIESSSKPPPVIDRDGLRPGLSGGLNTAQRQAVEHDGGPVMIVAGPGTGKTRTLTHRIAYLINKRGVSFQNILAVTFTNKAAEEMQERLKSLLRDKTSIPLIATFHSFCFSILNDSKGKIYQIIDDDLRRNIVLDAIKHVEDAGITVMFKADMLRNLIISAKQKLLEPHEPFGDLTDSEKESFSTVYRAYQKLLSIQGLFDYEDLILKTVKLFEQDENTRKKYQEVFKFIFVDEYQDLNAAQYRIIRALSSSGNPDREIFVIGDPDQSIYGFRGSDVRYFDRFAEDYPDARIIKLTRNYRSVEAILEASYQVIKRNKKDVPETRIYSEIDGIKTIGILELDTGKAEAVAVGKIIEEMIGGIGFHSVDFGKIDHDNNGTHHSFSDMAVLYRTGDQGRVFSDVFDKAGIPYQIVSRENLYKQKGISALLSLLKIVEGLGSYSDFGRILNLTKPTISKKTAEIFKSWSYKNGFGVKEALFNAKRFPIPDLSRTRRIRLYDFIGTLSVLEKEIRDMSVEKKLLYLVEKTKLSLVLRDDTKFQDALKRILDVSGKFGTHTPGFFVTAALQTDTDTYMQRSEKVSLMTMHASKGLEFPIVFIAGCEKDLIPYQPAKDEAPDIDEERRLFYVAMTRAKHRLYLTHVKKRQIYGRQVQREISPFVLDIEGRLRKHEASVIRKKKKSGQKQLSLF